MVQKLRWFETALLVIVFCSHNFADLNAAEHGKPNIVMIFADDLGWGDLGCYGHPHAVTPNIDRLAREGTRFTRFYATGVTCCPSRTGFMTSRHPASFVNSMADHGFGDRPTITQLLHDNGYETGHFGKWHIGPNQPDGIYGLDEVAVIGNSGKPNSGRDDDLFAAAIDFIQRDRNQPFYVNIWGHITHYPIKTFQGSDEQLRKLRVDESQFDRYMQQKFTNTRKWGYNVDKCMCSYLADVLALDAAVGRVLDVLDRCGIAEETIVVFSSDQGPAPNGAFQNARQRAMDPVFKANMLGWAGGLRGGKHEQYEGGIRIPFILRWPGRVPADHVNSHSVLSGLDWLPTLCSLTSTPYDEEEFEGLDASDIWMGSNRRPKRSLFWKAGGSLSALSDPWKLHFRGKTTELYNLEQDPGETTNLVSRNPKIKQQMIDATEKWNESLPTRVRRGAQQAK